MPQYNVKLLWIKFLMWQPSHRGKYQYTTKILAVCMNEYACVKEAERVNETWVFSTTSKVSKQKQLRWKREIDSVKYTKKQRRSMEKDPFILWS